MFQLSVNSRMENICMTSNERSLSLLKFCISAILEHSYIIISFANIFQIYSITNFADISRFCARVNNFRSQSIWSNVRVFVQAYLLPLAKYIFLSNQLVGWEIYSDIFVDISRLWSIMNLHNLIGFLGSQLPACNFLISANTMLLCLTFFSFFTHAKLQCQNFTLY